MTIFFITTLTNAQTVNKYNGHVIIMPDEIKWSDGPLSLPAGAKMIKMEGDPKDSGLFTIRLKLPAGYKIMPHWHTATEHVTVINGSFYMGAGEKLDENNAMKIPTGGFVMMLTGTRHFGFTKSGCIIQINGIGPWKVNYVNADDDPRNTKKN